MVKLDKKFDILNLEFTEITSRTYLANYKDYYDVNAGAIILEHYIICIDTLMYPKQARMFKNYLEQKFYLPVKYLVISHYHGDHLFGMSAFEDTEIIGSKVLTANMQVGYASGQFRDFPKIEEGTTADTDQIIEEYDYVPFPFNGSFSANSRVYLTSTGPGKILALSYGVVESEDKSG